MTCSSLGPGRGNAKEQHCRSLLRVAVIGRKWKMFEEKVGKKGTSEGCRAICVTNSGGLRGKKWGGGFWKHMIRFTRRDDENDGLRRCDTQRSPSLPAHSNDVLSVSVSRCHALIWICVEWKVLYLGPNPPLPTHHENDISPPVRLLDKQFHIRREFVASWARRATANSVPNTETRRIFFFTRKRDRYTCVSGNGGYEMRRMGRGITLRIVNSRYKTAAWVATIMNPRSC
jgi:hypothetical protein